MAGLANTARPKAMHDNRNTCRTSVKTDPAGASVKWVYDILAGENFYGSGCVVREDGSIVVGSEGSIYCLDPGDIAPGHLWWRYPIPGGGWCFNVPSILDGDHIVFGDDYGPLRSIDNPTTENWVVAPPAWAIWGGLAVDDLGNIYGVDENRRLLSVSPAGALNWYNPFGGDVTLHYLIGCPALDGLGNFWVPNWWNNHLYRCSCTTGLVNLDIDLWGPPNVWAETPKASATIDEAGNVYAASYSNVVKYTADGTKVWYHATDNTAAYAPCALLSNGTLLYEQWDGWLYCLSCDDGSEVWKVRYDPTGWNMYGAPAIDGDDNIWLPVYGGNVKCLDVDGNVVWTENLGENCLNSVCIDGNGYVYFVTDTKVHCIDAHAAGGETFAAGRAHRIDRGVRLPGGMGLGRGRRRDKW